MPNASKKAAKRRRREQARQQAHADAASSVNLAAPGSRRIELLDGALQLAVSCILPALVFLPWFTDVIAAKITLALAWLGATAFAFRHFPRRGRSLSIVAAILAAFGATQVQPVRGLAGTVEATVLDGLRHRFAGEKEEAPSVAVGNTILRWNGGDESMVSFFEQESNSLKLELIDGKTVVTTNIRDGTGALIATITRNDWKVAEQPASWDFNYSRNALEIKDRDNKVIFQMEVDEHGVHLQGEWRADRAHQVFMANGVPIESVRIVATPPDGMGFITNPEAFRSCQPGEARDAGCAQEIKPIFRYPGELYRGERVD